MIELFDLGEFFLNSLDAIGDFLLKPMGEVLPSLLVDGINNAANPWFHPLTSWMYEAAANAMDQSIAMWIFGTGLITIITIKFIKFFLDIFT